MFADDSNGSTCLPYTAVASTGSRKRRKYFSIYTVSSGRKVENSSYIALI